MKTHARFVYPATLAFTLLELMVVLAIGFILLAMLLPAGSFRAQARASRLRCVSNLKQVGLCYRLWAGDNGGNYPMQVPVTNGGTMELIGAGFVAPHFTVMSNLLGTPKLLLCPDDKERAAATSFNGMANLNVSYFVGLNATPTSPNAWLGGDRNIISRDATNPLVSVRGVFVLPTNNPVRWTDKLHMSAGNLCFADGSVQQYSSSKLTCSLSYQTNAPVRLAMPE